MRRLPPVEGEWIDRTRAVEFRFEGEATRGYAGDTITSALLAAGRSTLARSFKYHRPRGALSAADHDANVLVQVEHQGRSIPNVRADVTGVAPGMDVRAVNTGSGLATDRLRVLDRLGRFLPVGFYYKAFHSRRLFPRWERYFRRVAGLGAVSVRTPRRRTPKRYDHTDVLVIGAGPAGIAAALAAADEGRDVLLVDENRVLGGSGLYARGGQVSDLQQVTRLLGRVAQHPRIRTQVGSYAAGCYTDLWVPLVNATCLTKVRARAIVFAQGAFEQPAVFRNNDLPGVMLASAAQRLLYRYAVAPCSRVLLLLANAQGYAAALDALAHGIEVVAVVDLRTAPGPSTLGLRQRVEERGVPVLTGAVVYAAHPGSDGRVAEAEVRTWSSGHVSAIPGRRFRIDGLWMSVGYAPAASLLVQAGGRMRFAAEMGQFVPAHLPAGLFVAGKLNGVYGFAARLQDGLRAGQHAARHCCGDAARSRDAVGTLRARRSPSEVESPSHPYPIVPHPKHRNFIDFDEDLQLKDLENAVQEGFDSVELLKRYSTLGMGPSQGKHSNMLASRVLAQLRGEPLDHVGSTTARPMYHPVPLSHLAGRGFSPERRTPLDAAHEAAGAVWMPAGPWRRPAWYAPAGETRADALAAEVCAVRERAGLIDVGTLGKIEVHGPQAAEFLDRVYTGRFATLKTGMTRYGLMLDDSGVIVDDGVIARLGAEHFYFTTTTGNSVAIYRELGRLAAEWAFEVALVNLTGHYAALNLAGPRARAILAQLTSLDLSGEAFPYLGVREAEVAGVTARLLRVGFVGEWGYEIHVPADGAQALWKTLLAAGAPHDLRPFGVEAQRLLRLEKGHLIVGQDTDGLTDPLQAGCAWAVKMDKPFFVGQRSLRILERRPRRQQLVGFTVDGDAGRVLEESLLVIERGEIAGRLTSVAWSPTLGKTIGLALVAPAVATGSRLQVRLGRRHGGPAAMLEATVTTLPFYDPGQSRQKELAS